MAQAKPSNVLITGGLGYVGGRVAEHLIKSASGLSVRLMTHSPAHQIPDWATEIETVHGDVLDDASIASALDGVDTVIHLAAVNEIQSANDPDLALEVNGRGTYRLLERCRQQGISRFVYFSTFHVYGPEAAQPITEESPTRPVHPYAITHRLAEDYVNWFKHSHGINTMIFRLSNGFGYPTSPQVNRWSLVFNDLCLQAVRQQSVQLNSSGVQHRDFISLTDVARAVEHLLGLPGESWGDGLLNLGGGCSMSILDVANRVADEYQSKYGVKIPVTAKESSPGQVSAPVDFSIEKFKRTGFSLAGNMSQEIQKTFEVCEQLPKEGSPAA